MAASSGPEPTSGTTVSGDAAGCPPSWNAGADLAGVVNSAPFGIYVVDEQFRVHSVNDEAQLAFANVRPLIGRDFGEAMRVLWPESFAAEAVRRFRHTLDTGEPYVAPRLTEARADVGAEESYEWELRRVRLPGDQWGVACYYYDSTKLRRTELELYEARRKVDAALLAGEVGIYYWDILADRLSGDANFLSMFGMANDASGYAPLDQFMERVHPEDRASVTAQIEATLEHDAPYRAEYRILHPSGERWVIARGTVERTSAGAPRGWAGVVVDITERKRVEDERRSLLESERAARAEAERASRIKDEFLATLSHELRTPLSAILGWTEILKQRRRDPVDLANGLQTIERNARAQIRIIEDLLDMSSIITGKVRLEVQRIPATPVIQAAVDTIRPTADTKGVEIGVQLDGGDDTIRGDASRLQQVFWNLLSNAVKFTPRGGRVEVRLEHHDGRLDVRVADTGNGISSEFLPVVFDRFRQADASTTRHHGGLGLGLAIVKQIVELHGGTVAVASAGPGQGATFTVSLPIPAAGIPDPHPATDRRRSEPESPEEAAPAGNIAGLHVLVVDDEPDARALLQRILENADARVTAVASAAAAMDAVRTLHPDLLISDIGMPQEDGYSLIRRVRSLSDAEGGRIPAVALTAYARAEDGERALGAGFTRHVSKPVDPARLVGIVAALVRRPEG
jgi:PAS domain S-box-containing protein